MWALLAVRIASAGEQAPAWIEAHTEHYDFHYFPEAPISPEMQKQNEWVLAHMEKELGVTAPGRIAFYRYQDKTQKGELTGNGGNAHTDDTTIHTIWPIDDHEIVHILALQWGETDQALLAEGLAVHLDKEWQGKPVDDYARGLLDAGAIPPLASLVPTAAFRAADDVVTYAVAGSFVGYLVSLKGMDGFRRVYVKGEPFEARLKAVYGRDLATLDAEWRAWLAKR